MLQAAAEVFLEQGYEGARLEQIISRSGGSLSTLYAEFKGKEGLFAALINEICERMVCALPALDVSPAAPADEVLLSFGLAYMRLLLEPVSLALYRIAMSEGVRRPELSHAIYEAGPGAAAHRLSEYLERQHAIGALDIVDPGLSARHFLEIVKGDLHLRALLGLGTLPSGEEVRECVASAVCTFLVGVSSGRR
jgi:AcrR family transcriptional regulator